VTTPPVHLWYGTDTLVPLQMGRYLGEMSPGSRLKVYPGEGHLTFNGHWLEFLSTLAACQAVIA